MNAIPAKKGKQCGIVVEQEAHYARVRASLADVEAGRVRKFKTAAELLAALDVDEAANDGYRAGNHPA